MCKKISLLLILLIIMGQMTLFADAPYFTYYYSFFNYPVETTPGYLPNGFVTGHSLGIGHFRQPTDICVSGGEVYIMDAGNERVVVLGYLDGVLSFDRIIIPSYPSEEGAGPTPLPLVNPRGVYVDSADGTIYISDTDAQVVWCLDNQGALLHTLNRPSLEIMPEGFDFRPQGVIIDSSDIIYVLSTASAGSYAGSLMYNKNQEFLGFFGSETVRLNAWDRVQRMWRIIMTSAQREGVGAFVPETINNFDIGPDGFIYTVRSNATGFRGQVRKLNSMGNDVLRTEWGPGDRMIFGDIQTFWDARYGYDATNFIDIKVDDYGFINVLDLTRGRVFQYDSYCNFLFVFGGPDIKEGTFRTVTAVDTIGDDVLVLDTDFNTLTVFSPTAFGREVRAALIHYGEGRYQDAVAHWEAALKHDTTYPIANKGMGKAMMQLGSYRESMDFFKLAYSPDGYSDALYYYRMEWSRSNFPFMALGLVLLIALFATVSVMRGRKVKKVGYVPIEKKWKFPFYSMFHPIKGFSDMKYEKKGSILYANIIIGAFFLSSVATFWMMGFAYNFSDLDEFNIIFTLISTAGLFAAWALTNWSVGAIVDGEATFKETWCFSAYALLPYIIVTFIRVLVSNALTWQETSVFYLLYYGGFIWSLFNMFVALKEAHQFNIKKTVFTSLLTVCGLILVIMVVTIGYSMLVQLYAFITSISNELALRA